MQAPTDNLYKFIAISGLICFLYFQYDFDRKAESLLKQVDDYNMQSAILEASIENSKVLLSNIEARNTMRFGSDSSLEEKIEAYDRFLSFQEKFNEKKIEIAKLDETEKIIDRLMKELKSMSESYPIFSGLSSGLFGLGLFLWYQKTQKHLDRKDRNNDREYKPERFTIKRRKS